MAHSIYNGRQSRTSSVADASHREAMNIAIGTSIILERLLRVCKHMEAEHGLSEVLRTDNGPYFLGKAFTSSTKGDGMAIDYIQPGKPNQNAYIERFNRTCREEVLDQHLFVRLEAVREATCWRMIDDQARRDPTSAWATGRLRQRANKPRESELWNCRRNGRALEIIAE